MMSAEKPESIFWNPTLRFRWNQIKYNGEYLDKVLVQLWAGSDINGVTYEEWRTVETVVHELDDIN